MDRLREFYKENRLRKRRIRLEKICEWVILEYRDTITIEITKPTATDTAITKIESGFMVIRISGTLYWERIFVGRSVYEHYRFRGVRSVLFGPWELIRKGKIEDIV